MSDLEKTALYDEHLALGAKMVDFGGWEMPIQYKNLKQEVLAVRENIGVFDVSHMGEFRVTGSKATEFVDYMVTNNIKAAENGKAIYSPLCNEEGRIIDDLIVYKVSSSELFICVNAANIQKDYNWMQQHADKFDCKFENLSDQYSLLALQGPKSFNVLSELIPEIEDIDYYSIQMLDAPTGVQNFVARTGYTGEDGFEIFGDHAFVQSIWKKLMDQGVEPCGLGSRDVLRLEVCFPLYGNELNDQITPLDAGLKWTVKMDKPNFMGKKALEIHQPTHRLIKLQLEKGIPRSGYEVQDDEGNTLGTVTSGSMSVVLQKGIALASVDKKLYDDSKKLNINIRGKNYPATINKKPFVTGGHK